MTRNDAYKAARIAWRGMTKRGARELPIIWQSVAFELRVAGATSRDVQMVRAWLKAFYAGRRYPDESTMRRIETTEY